MFSALFRYESKLIPHEKKTQRFRFAPWYTQFKNDFNPLVPGKFFDWDINTFF